jgi:dUTP pyrophosphatase
MKIKNVNKSKHSLPSYSTYASAGVDLRANIDRELIFKTRQRALIQTGFFRDAGRI